MKEETYLLTLNKLKGLKKNIMDNPSNLDEPEIFLKRFNLPNLTQEEV